MPLDNYYPAGDRLDSRALGTLTRAAARNRFPLQQVFNFVIHDVFR